MKEHLQNAATCFNSMYTTTLHNSKSLTLICTFKPSKMKTLPVIYRTTHCGPNGVLIVEISLYRTAYYGPHGVLNIEVSLYRTAYYGPHGVLI